jgi:hypothetical protein
LTTATRGLIIPPRTATAAITSGTPCPLASRAKKCTRRPTVRPPTPVITGSAARPNGRVASAQASVRSRSTKLKNWINSRNAIAANPVARPMSTASNTDPT